MSIIVVPAEAAPNWSPAFPPIGVGETLPRGLDCSRWAMRNRLRILDIVPQIDPLLVVDGPAVLEGATSCMSLVAPNTPGLVAAIGTELRIAFLIRFRPADWRGGAADDGDDARDDAHGDGAVDGESGVDTRVVLARQPIRAGLPAGLEPVATEIAPPDQALVDAGGALFDADGFIIAA